MNTQLIVEPKSNYGETRIYPKCDMSKLFAQLLNQTTLTPANMQNIVRMGFTIKAEYTEPKGFAQWTTVDTSVWRQTT